MINKITTCNLTPRFNGITKNNTKSNKDLQLKRASLDAQASTLNDISFLSLILGCGTQIIAPVRTGSNKINKTSAGLILFAAITFVASCIKKMRLSKEYDLMK